MHNDLANEEGIGNSNNLGEGAFGWSLTRRSLLGAGAALGLAALTFPTERAFAWSSWTNATSKMLKGLGMGDCVHEDLVQIAYARLMRNHANDGKPNSFLNPWAGTIQSDARYAEIDGDTVDVGKGETFADADDLAAHLFRENLAYLRIGSFWNDAAANMLADFSYSCYYADYIPKFSGADRYEGAWDVGQHIWEANERNKTDRINLLDALVQFTMNDRNNFIHGMLSSTASRSEHLKQSEIKKFALQWMGVAYEYARTGEVTATSDVTKEQAEKIFKGFIDTYGQLDMDAHDMSVSLQVSASEASIKLPHRRLRLRALGMMCHTMEDLWCPAHTCRTYNTSGGIPEYSILAFCNYKLQNGNMPPMFGYHIPFDRYALSDANNSTNWREALTRGTGGYKGSETLANTLDDGMSCLGEAHTYFNTLGMNETIACITKLFEFMYAGTAWDDGVRNWIDTEVMSTYFDADGQSYVCDAGRRCLHTPTYIINPIKSMERACGKAGLSRNYEEALAAASSFNDWQRGAHLFYSGQYNTGKSKYITSGNEGANIWSDSEGESRLVNLVDKLYEGYSSLSASKKSSLLSYVGCNGCHNMVSTVGWIGGMLQDFNIDLRGSLRSASDPAMKKIKELRSFFQSGLQVKGKKTATQALTTQGIFGVEAAYADEDDDSYVTSNMAIEDLLRFEDGSYLIAVRDMDSLETSIMFVPKNTLGKDKLAEGLNNLTITYTISADFEDDLDYSYFVSEIDYSDLKKNVFLVTGTVKSVSVDKKSLVLDLSGISEFSLDVRKGFSDIPQKGAYICARYSIGKTGLELIDYDELENPGKLTKVTYPVARIAGSRMWLLTNKDDPETGYRDLLEIDYGAADVRSVPQEGYEATVYYHDEVYGSSTEAVGGASNGTTSADASTNMAAQSESDELTDSATPGYIELGDEYGKLEYGNDVFHVANVIAGTNKDYDDKPSPSDPTDPESEESEDTAKKTGGSGANAPTTPKTGSSEKSSSSTPKTNDPLSSFNGVLFAAAAAGAAMAAYSARRVANERKDSKEE